MGGGSQELFAQSAIEKKGLTGSSASRHPRQVPLVRAHCTDEVFLGVVTNW
jgi:hypothetical protein